MDIMQVLKSTKPLPPLQKAVLNILYTSNWYQDLTAGIFTQFDVTPQQYNVLRILRGKHPAALSSGEVKEVMMDKNPDLTRLCDRICKKNFVERELNPENRRQVLLRITPAGLDLLQQIDPVFEMHAKKWTNLTDEEAETLSGLLDKLRG